MTRAPQYPRWRPDFEAPGPHIVIEQKKKISFLEPLNRDPNEETDEDDDIRVYRYYESDKILGKLYRAIDEKKIFKENQDRSRAGGDPQISTIIQTVWEHVQNKCKIAWEHKKDWARDVRER